MAGLVHRIDNEIITSKGKLFTREIGVILCVLGGAHRKVFARSIKQLADARDISARCQVVALEYWTRVGLITHFTEDGEYYLKAAPKDGHWTELEDVLFQAKIPFWALWGILCIRTKWVSKGLYEFDRKGKTFPALIDCVPQPVRGAPARGKARQALVDTLERALRDSGVISTVRVRGQGRWAPYVAVNITPETVQKLALAAFSLPPASVGPAFSLPPASVAPAFSLPPDQSSCCPPLPVLSQQCPLPTVSPEVPCASEHVPERTPARAAAGGNANHATSAVAVLEPAAPATGPPRALTELTTEKGAIPVGRTAWRPGELLDIEQALGLTRTKKISQYKMCQYFDQVFPKDQILPIDIINAIKEYRQRDRWKSLRDPCLAVFLTGDNREDFIQQVHITARIRRLHAQATDPAAQFQRAWNRPANFHIKTLTAEWPMPPGTEKDVAFLYLNRYGTTGLDIRRQGSCLEITLPAASQEVQDTVYADWTRMRRSGIRVDCERRILRQLYRRLKPIPRPTKLQLLEQKLCLLSGALSRESAGLALAQVRPQV